MEKRTLGTALRQIETSYRLNETIYPKTKYKTDYSIDSELESEFGNVLFSDRDISSWNRTADYKGK